MLQSLESISALVSITPPANFKCQTRHLRNLHTPGSSVAPIRTIVWATHKFDELGVAVGNSSPPLLSLIRWAWRGICWFEPACPFRDCSVMLHMEFPDGYTSLHQICSLNAPLLGSPALTDVPSPQTFDFVSGAWSDISHSYIGRLSILEGRCRYHSWASLMVSIILRMGFTSLIHSMHRPFVTLAGMGA